MCGISGFFNAEADLLKNRNYNIEILNNMIKALKKRGPDDDGTYLCTHCGLAHTRLSIIDLVTGKQPITYKSNGYHWSICYNGELYNTEELRNAIKKEGYTFQTTSDTEVVLMAYIAYGPSFAEKLNGIYSFAILDEKEDCVFLYRDRMGVKPLFYTKLGDTTIFASELKGLFAYPGMNRIIDKKSLNEVFSLGPAKTPGCGVYKDVSEVLPGHFVKINKNQIIDCAYFELEAKEHTDSYEETLEKTRFLVTDAISRQMVSDVPICTFLSGGVDSSLVSAVCASELKKLGKQLNTFSFEFANNDKYFESNSFQPSLDSPYAAIMAEYLQTNHSVLTCTKEAQADLLHDSLLAHDLPAMADVDSSMLYFCNIVKDYNKVVLTGECADEIFGGYPWFHRSELFSKDTFPWTTDLSPRKALLKDEFIDYLKMDEYVDNAYYTSILEVPTLQGETAREKRRREISYLNLRWFMQTLLDRMDRTSMYCGLEARVPFADHRIVEYLFNVPWDMKSKDGEVKGLLRFACKGICPDEILFRKKSPYPKTYDPFYEQLLAKRFSVVLEDSASPILEYIDKEKANTFLKSPSDYGKPWYGQLMCGPQMIAYLLQVNEWLTMSKL